MPGCDETCAIVLAAGRGRRMGGPKALMDVGGLAWWRIQAARLAGAGIRSAWVVSPEVAEAFGCEAGAPAALVIADADAPMFASVMAGLELLARDPPRAAFLLPIDVPAAGAGVWRELAEQGRPCIPCFEGRHGHPLYLPWNWIEQNLLNARHELATTRLDDLVRPELAHADVTDNSVVMNLNTPADVAAWVSRV